MLTRLKRLCKRPEMWVLPPPGGPIDASRNISWCHTHTHTHTHTYTHTHTHTYTHTHARMQLRERMQPVHHQSDDFRGVIKASRTVNIQMLVRVDNKPIKIPHTDKREECNDLAGDARPHAQRRISLRQSGPRRKHPQQKRSL